MLNIKKSIFTKKKKKKKKKKKSFENHLDAYQLI